MSLARPLGAKLFLEGLEVPLIGATMTHTVNQASIAYIDIVPHEKANHIKPRTHVVIAVRDYMNAAQGYPYVTAWEGEVFGISFGRTAGSRTLSIQCIDYSGYWDNAMMYFVNTMNSGVLGGGDIHKLGLDLTLAKKSGIDTKPVSTSVASFFDNVFDTVIKSGGDFLKAFVYLYKDLTKTNDFFQSGEARFKITSRFRIKSSGALSELIKDNAAKSWMSEVVNHMGGLTTMRNVVQDLMSLIFHDFVTVPFASSNTEVQRTDKKAEFKAQAASIVTTFDPTAAETQATAKKNPALGADPFTGMPAVGAQTPEDAANLQEIEDAKKSTTGTFAFKPNLYMCPPPVCNIFFPEEYSSFQFSRNFFREPTRLVYKPELPMVASGGEEKVSLPYSFHPESFSQFMLEKKADWTPFQDDSDFGIGAGRTFAPYGELAPDGSTMRVANFMTNEERFKGIWLTTENAVPASSQLSGTFEDVGKTSFLDRVARYLLYKKRYQGRSLQITSHLKLSVVPGFPVLVLDDSATKQNIVAYCDSVTHRIFAQEGGYTSASLSYARLVGEQGVSGEMVEEPVLPPWFDKAVFGTKSEKADENEPTGKLSGYYKELLGLKGFTALNEYYTVEGKPVTMRVAVDRLVAEYKSAKRRGAATIQTYIAKVTSRHYTRIRDTFLMMGASNNDPDTRKTNFMVFTGGPFATTDSTWGKTTALRRKVILKYRDALKSSRGARG